MDVFENKHTDHAWLSFVTERSEATLFHHPAWAAVLDHGVGHHAHFLSAHQDGAICGVLPLCQVESRLFGRRLVSLPHYLGGVCATCDEAADALLDRACAMTQELKADSLEIRGNELLCAAEHRGLTLDMHKASFLVDLTPGEEALWKGLRKQNRNRVRKSEQATPKLEMGHNLLDEFWHLFSLNTRAIGSLTFSARFFAAVLDVFGDNAQLLLARQHGQPVAAKLVVRFRDTLTMLWGGTDPREKADGANYWLTWETFRYALSIGCATLDMGRSTVDSGPYHFKSHWGGRELHHYWYLQQKRPGSELRAESPKFRLVRKVWRKLPLSVTRSVGPWLARQIP